ncbi:MAG TPA: DNA polymerase I [bacterium]|nr:DNA polymerase I [bacterium]
MTTTKEKLAIIDGNAVIYRAFYAVQSELSCQGQPTNAVYGFFSILFKVISELKPDYLIVALDRPEPTFRHQLSVEYKAQRVKQPDELYSQIPIIKQLLEKMAIPVLEKPGYEADDIIGTVVSSMPQLDNYIVTGDKDSFQLINESTRVYWLQQGLQKTIILDAAGVETVLNLRPDQVVDYKSLRGDPSDNIPGVPGIGDKTAVELLKAFDRLDQLQKVVNDNLEDERLKPRWRKLIAENQASLDLSQKLAQIDCAVPLEFSLDQARVVDFSQPAIKEAFLEWELRSLVPRLEKLRPVDNIVKEEIKSSYNLKAVEINNGEEARRAAADFSVVDEIAILPINEDKRTIGLVLANQQQAIRLIFNRQIQQGLFGLEQADNNNLIEPWREILANRQIKKVTFQAKEIIKLLAKYKIKLEGLSGDILLADYLINPGGRQSSLAEIAEKNGFSMINKKGEIDWRTEISQIIEIHNFLIKKLTENELLKIYYQVELPLIAVLAKMESVGVKIDQLFLGDLAKDWQSELDQLTVKIYTQAGEEFNINSPKQLQVILFEKLGLKAKGLSKTKSGLSTDAANLQKLNKEHPIISLLLEYREVAKLLNTYALALPRLADSRDSRLRATFHQAVTATGRLSSSDPNLQNIPTRTEMGKKLRQAFVAENGYQLLSFDYSQIELRIMASLANEESMVADFLAGLDIHLATAAKINKLSVEQVTKDQRRAAKAVNFGILYGQGPHGLAEATGLSYGEAKNFIEQYFAVYPKISRYIESLIKEARENGYATTVWGRRRYLPDLENLNPSLQRAAERMAVNLPIQGTAADIMKAAMIRVNNWLNQNFSSDEVRMILQIHDEIIIEAKIELIEKIKNEIPNLMTEVIDLAVPLAVSNDSGQNWAEL